jgi:hypothetical protein
MSSAAAITFDDIKSLIPTFSELEDLESRKYATKTVVENFHRYVKIINRQYSEVHSRWPEANALHIFMSFLLASDTHEDFQAKVLDPNFRLRVREELKNRLNAPLPEDKRMKEDEVAYKREEEIIENIMKNWSKSRMEQFIYLYFEYWGNIKKEEFAAKVGLQIHICEKLIKRLKDDGALKPRKRAHKNKEEIGYTEEELTGITFLKKGEKYRLGVKILNPKENPNNPLPGVPDPLTQKPMIYPMVCPEFYVLDKNTWTKRISDSHTHPYLNTHMVSKRDLIPLTIDNFNYYRDKLRNLDCSQYNL